MAFLHDDHRLIVHARRMPRKWKRGACLQCRSRKARCSETRACSRCSEIPFGQCTEKAPAADDSLFEPSQNGENPRIATLGDDPMSLSKRDRFQEFRRKSDPYQFETSVSISRPLTAAAVLMSTPTPSSNTLSSTSLEVDCTLLLYILYTTQQMLYLPQEKIHFPEIQKMAAFVH